MLHGLLYCIAAYIRMFPKKIFANTRLWGGITIITIVLSALSVVSCAWLGTVLDREMAFYFVSDSNKILAVVTALSAFLFFKNVRIPYNRFINTVAASAFGVLLIHANSATMRQWLWKDVLHNTAMYNSEFLYVHAIGSVLLIYIICTFIDYLRIRYIERKFFLLWDKHWPRIYERYCSFEGKLMKKCSISVGDKE